MNSWIFSICYYYCRYMWEYVSEDATNDGLPRRVSFKTPSPTAFADRTCIYILYITSLFYSVPFYISFLVLFYYPSGTTTGARYISCTERDLSFFLFFFVGARDGTRESVTRPHTTRSFLFVFFSACFSSLWSRSSHGTNSFRIPFHFCLLVMIPWESLISSDHWHTRPLYEIIFDCILYAAAVYVFASRFISIIRDFFFICKTGMLYRLLQNEKGTILFLKK